MVYSRGVSWVWLFGDNKIQIKADIHFLGVYLKFHKGQLGRVVYT